jgi:hypothetical protein
MDEYGGAWRAPVPNIGGVYAPPVVGSTVVLIFRKGVPGSPTIVSEPLTDWQMAPALEEAPEPSEDYPENAAQRGSLNDTIVRGGGVAVVASPLAGLLLDARNSGQPLRIQVPEGGTVRVSAANEASGALLLADPVLLWLQLLTDNYNALVARYNTLELWAVGMGLPAPGLPIPAMTPPGLDLVSSTFQIPSADATEEE